ncbi:MAG: hypothetical protein ABR577_16355 [Pyrinomonadaceae bacterium]
MKFRRGIFNRRRSFVAFFLAATLSFPAASQITPLHAHAQTESEHLKGSTSDNERLERAIIAVCLQREGDALGSVPIDQMQARTQIAAEDASVQQAAARARRLLPVARSLTLKVLRQLARDYHVDLNQSRAVGERIEAVDEIEADADLRDNALIVPDEARKIYFGTIFLVSLQSDEGMIGVLAHELTHAADGEDAALQRLFRLVASRAANLTGLEISELRGEELTSDLVGALAARFFVDAKPNKEPLARRLARSVEHNCVADDGTDEAHLSPRNTLRAVLALDATLARAVVAERTTGDSGIRTHHR